MHHNLLTKSKTNVKNMTFLTPSAEHEVMFISREGSNKVETF